MVVAILITVGFCAITIVLNMYNEELVEFINDKNVKQMNLMTELKKDPLTGLYNRRSFEESLEAEIVRNGENGEKAYIAIFDIDHFKNVNDTYGHSNGDVVIKALCKMLKEKSKDTGLAFRYGGEEFVILFSDIDLPKVINVVEDIRTEFRCYYFQFMNNSGITCSCGIAEYAPGESSKAWFNRADNSLYQAKEAGRNRTVVSE
jgi:diguanylate cyclase (GGDEF)-like protein